MSEADVIGKDKCLRTNRPDLVLLDLLNLFIAPLCGGAGAYVAYYFAACRHWDAGQIGLILSVMAISLAIAQVPAGLLIDRIKRRNQIVAAALAVIAASWLSMLIFPIQPVVFIAQALIGVSCAFFGPAIASMSLGLVGYEGLELRLGRSGIFAHLGNILTAILVGFFTGYLTGKAIIGLLVFFAFLAAISALAISRGKGYATVNETCEATSNFARNCGERFHPLLKGLLGLLATPGSRIFALGALLYTVANASMLPLMVQLISRQPASAASVQLPSSLLLTELVMIPVCFFAAKHAHIGRRPLLIISYIFLVLRGLGFTFIKIPAAMVAMQILDGISAGIFGYVVTLVVADLCRHNNRFNATLSALYMLLTLANGCSEFASGMMASHFGFTITFALLTFIASVGLMVILTLLPETREATIPVLAENENALPALSMSPVLQTEN